MQEGVPSYYPMATENNKAKQPFVAYGKVYNSGSLILFVQLFVTTIRSNYQALYSVSQITCYFVKLL